MSLSCCVPGVDQSFDCCRVLCRRYDAHAKRHSRKPSAREKGKKIDWLVNGAEALMVGLSYGVRSNEHLLSVLHFDPDLFLPAHTCAGGGPVREEKAVLRR